MMKYLLASISILSAVLAQILIKKATFFQFAEKKWFLIILISLLLYAITFFTQTMVVRMFPISKILPVSAIAVMILIFISGIVFFGESVNLKQIIGILFGVLSIILILN
ncbi:MAG: EamA family transporter [Lentimicrobium sp.]|nr:EamA family transporter [Lentimicrobium sp.]